jgi:hypothetical protein
MFKLDRTSGKGLTHDQASKDAILYLKQKTIEERLKIAMYLNSIAYNFDVNNPPRMDKSVFKARKHER